ncbi:hypothetical protein ACFL27_19065 [candidate division CSSED10-310 bacterium]|uniref:Uncharacterized protein n=1 Tax=candidate division CSSED10-310 bacterium TaxID=2855610 RepID=A0ABV6Z1K3_UNCC1
MLSVEVKTRLSHTKTMNCLKFYFGEGGVGLNLLREDQLGVSFEGRRGFVSAALFPVNGETKVNIQSKELDYQVEELVNFLRRN